MRLRRGRKFWVYAPQNALHACLQGQVQQNRAVEGDEVALEILPLSKWFIIGSMLERAKEHPSAEVNGNSPSRGSHLDPLQPLAPDSGAECSSSPTVGASSLGSARSPMIDR